MSLGVCVKNVPRMRLKTERERDDVVIVIIDHVMYDDIRNEHICVDKFINQKRTLDVVPLHVNLIQCCLFFI